MEGGGKERAHVSFSPFQWIFVCVECALKVQKVLPELHFPLHFLVSFHSMCTRVMFIQWPAETWSWSFLVSFEHARSLAPGCILPHSQGDVGYPESSRWSSDSQDLPLNAVASLQHSPIQCDTLRPAGKLGFEFATVSGDMAPEFEFCPYSSLNQVGTSSRTASDSMALAALLHCIQSTGCGGDGSIPG